MNKYTRRDFLGAGSAALAGAGLSAAVPTRRAAGASKRPVPPSDQLRFGTIGCRGMGWSDTQVLRAIDGVECVALCDVDQGVLDERAAELEEQSGQQPARYEDYRRLLEEENLDFVVIGTPDHWHCLPMVHACQAGLDVYVEKPLGRTIEECRLMAAAAQQYDRVVQVGQWQRSGPHWQEAVDYLRTGAMGDIRLVKTWAYQGWMNPVPPKPDQAAPQGVNYDLWLGPAPKRPFNPNRFHFDWRWFWDYGGGLMTDWGVHLIDFALYGMDVQYPEAVTSMGGAFGYEDDDASETPDTQQALFDFGDFSMLWEQATGINGGPYDRNHGVAFIGNNGTLVIDRSGWQVYPETEDGNYKTEALPVRQGGGDDLALHAENFIESMRTRSTPNCPAAVAAQTAITATLGNVALLAGERVRWDEEAGEVTGTTEAGTAQAASLVRPTYRAPWSLPAV